MGASQSVTALVSYPVTLLQSPIPPSNREFWSKLWTIPQSLEDVAAILSLTFLRQLLHKQPENLSTLIKLTAIQLHNLIRSSQYRDPVQSVKLGTLTNNASGALTPAGVEYINQNIPIIRNCILILTRIFTLLSESIDSEFVRDYMFNGLLPGADGIRIRENQKYLKSIKAQRSPTESESTSSAASVSTSAPAAAAATGTATTTAPSTIVPASAQLPTPAVTAIATTSSSTPITAVSTDSNTTGSQSQSAVTQTSIPSITDTATANSTGSATNSTLSTASSTPTPKSSIDSAAAAAPVTESTNKSVELENKSNYMEQPETAIVTASAASIEPQSISSQSDERSVSITINKSETPTPTAIVNESKSSVPRKVSLKYDSWLIGSLFGVSLGQSLIELLTETLFVEKYTIATPTMNASKNRIELGKLWTSGIGIGVHLIDPIQDWQLDLHRTEIIRALIVACSGCMFQFQSQFIAAQSQPLSNSNTIPDPIDRFIGALVSKSNPLAPTLCWSLINLILNYNNNEGLVPYSYSLYSDYRTPLVEISIQLLLICLDHKANKYLEATTAATTSTVTSPPHQPQQQPNNNNSNNPTNNITVESTVPVDSTDNKTVSNTTPATSTSSNSADNNNTTTSAAIHPTVPIDIDNVFYSELFNLSNPTDLTHLYQSLCRLLQTNLLSASTILPGSIPSIEFHSEILVLFWKLFDSNPALFQHLLINSNTIECDILQLITPLLYYIYISKSESSQLGLMYVCVFILLKLSGEREFAVSLNKSVPIHQLNNINILQLLELNSIFTANQCNYADLLICVSHSLILNNTTVPSHLDSLLKVLLTLLANISPYITKLHSVTCNKLLNLFEFFSSNSFLYSNSNNYQYIILLLDIFNNAIQYQSSGYSHLFYAITRRANLFYSLTNNSNIINNSSSNNNNNNSTGFIPTPEWYAEYQSKLPLEPIYRLLDFFLPRIESVLKSLQNPGPITVAQSESTILELISTTTLVGILPIPQSILVRKYIRNSYTNQWFTSYCWGLIYLKQQSVSGIALWDSNKIKLFQIAQLNNNNNNKNVSGTAPSTATASSATSVTAATANNKPK